MSVTNAITEIAKKAAPDDFSPPETARRVEATGIAKANRDTLSTVLLGMLAGAFIGLGAMLYTLVTTDTGLGFGLTKLLGGFVFCLGLVLVVVAGAELFTGNSLMLMSWLSRKISTGRLLRSWGLVYISNLMGSVALAVLMFYTLQWGFHGSGVGANALLIANAKVNIPFATALTRGIMCNILVCLAVWLCFSARTIPGKILGILFPITAFVAAGFEHSIANMYFIPIGMLLASQPTVVEAAGLTAAGVANLNMAGFIGNLVPVTIGNVIGGGLLVGAVYWAAYLRQDRAAVWTGIKQGLQAATSFPHPTKAGVVVAPTGSGTMLEILAKAVLAKRTGASGAAAPEIAGSPALRQVLAKAVLARAGGDDSFFAKLAKEPDKVLKGYALKPAEKAALSSGDVNWLKSKVETLNDPVGAWLTLRLTTDKGEK